MSSYLVDKSAVIYIVLAAMSEQAGCQEQDKIRWFNSSKDYLYELAPGDFDRGAEVANMLWQENARGARWGKIPEITAADLRHYHKRFADSFSREVRFFGPVQVLKACQHLAFQSEGNPREWAESEAANFLDTLKQCAYECLPAWEETPSIPAAWTQEERFLADAERSPRNVTSADLLPGPESKTGEDRGIRA